MASKPKSEPEFELEFEDLEDGPVIEVEDDTPEEDRGREPMPKEVVDELEADELEEYDERVKQRLKQAKKVYHDERRAREREAREKAEAVAATQRLLEENRRLKATVGNGEKELVAAYKRQAELEQLAARQAYREAHEAGDTDKALEAQEKLADAAYRLRQVESYTPSLQPTEEEVSYQQQVQTPQLDPKTIAWQERNTWWGSDDEMTASALGLHQKLVRERGPQYAGTDEYWGVIDKTMRRRFPEYFGDELEAASSAPKRASVVAPASRSRSPRKIKLTKSQVALAKKLGLTPEQYAQEMLKMEG
jgi:hypothetical protein